MTLSKPVDDAPAWMSGDYSESTLQFRQAIVREGLSKLTETTVIFQSGKEDLDLSQFIGQPMKVHIDTGAGQVRDFGGICVSVEALGFKSGFFQFVAEVRPHFWILTRSQDCRVFQNMTTKDIVEKILGDEGIKDFKFKLSDTYEPRQYCVQYNETNYDFICRLLEQEGIYFYFDTKSGYQDPDELTFCDGKTSHKWDPSVEFFMREAGDFSRRQITEWAPTRTITSGKVTIDDYQFFAPTAKKAVTEARGSTGCAVCDSLIYNFPGGFRAEGTNPEDKLVKEEKNRASKRARVRLEAETVPHVTWRGESSVTTLGAGRLFKMEQHPHAPTNTDYLVTGAVHYINASMDMINDATTYALKPQNFDMPESREKTVYSCMLDAIDATIQFRTPLKTAWPIVPGLQTAVVVGPDGEEIWTDDYGRIRVQFPWDREGKLDENSSCWVRVVTPWAGKSWGFAAVPRVGQEVVIQFEEGNPGRPICTGMLYNEDNPKVYSKKPTKTQIGIRTDSTKGVKDAEAFNELMFDDETNKEMMRVQAQKNHQFLTKNISRIGVGLETAKELEEYEFKHAKDGSLLQVVRKHMEEEIQEGNHFYKVTKGSQTKVVHKNSETTIETGNSKLTVQEGMREQTIKDDFLTTVQSGSIGVEAEKGNIAVQASKGIVEIEAMQKIVLKVGKTTLTLDPKGLSIEAMNVDVSAKMMATIKSDGMATVKGKMSTFKGDVMLTLKGGVTMIN